MKVIGTIVALLLVCRQVWSMKKVTEIHSSSKMKFLPRFTTTTFCQLLCFALDTTSRKDFRYMSDISTLKARVKSKLSLTRIKGKPRSFIRGRGQTFFLCKDHTQSTKSPKVSKVTFAIEGQEDVVNPFKNTLSTLGW